MIELGVGADDPDDLDRIAANLAALDLSGHRDESPLSCQDPGTEVTVTVEIVHSSP